MDQENELNAQEMFAAHEANLEDFWGRREHRRDCNRAFHLFGQPVLLSANESRLLEAADVVRPLYSMAAPADTRALNVHLVATDTLAGAGPLPPNLFDRIHYVGRGPWIYLHLGPWGMAWADLQAGRAQAVLAPSLASQPAAVGRFVLNTLLLNLLDGRGYSMIHATSLVRDGGLLLLMGAHHSGKSTAALHLALAGYRFIADSQLYVAPRTDALELVGFPVGQSKLRPNMIAAFPRLARIARPEMVRQEEKYRIDLRQVDPKLVHEEALVNPEVIHLCLVERQEKPETVRWPASQAEMRAAMVRNGPYWNEAPIWHAHLRQLERLLAQADYHHLKPGTDPTGLVAALDRLFS